MPDQLRNLELNSPPWIFAVLCLGKLAWNQLFSPDLVPCLFGMFPEVFISFSEATIYGGHCFFGRLIVAIVYNCPCHPAENGLNYVEELGRGRYLIV